MQIKLSTVRWVRRSLEENDSEHVKIAELTMDSHQYPSSFRGTKTRLQKRKNVHSTTRNAKDGTLFTHSTTIATLPRLTTRDHWSPIIHNDNPIFRSHTPKTHATTTTTTTTAFRLSAHDEFAKFFSHFQHRSYGRHSTNTLRVQGREIKYAHFYPLFYLLATVLVCTWPLHAPS